MKQQTVREALRDACPKKCAATRACFSWVKKSANTKALTRFPKGMLDEFGSKRVIDTPITEHGFAGIAVGAPLVA